MSEKPILFSGEMVKAILEGRKAQTRRVTTPQFRGTPMETQTRGLWHDKKPGTGFTLEEIKCPYGATGDRLWVRETFKFKYSKHWKPSIHMPRWASRITLETTEIRVERLHDISEADAKAEGIIEQEVPNEKPIYLTPGVYQPFNKKQLEWSPTAICAYSYLWESINGKGSWALNPWVWAITFKKL